MVIIYWKIQALHICAYIFTYVNVFVYLAIYPEDLKSEISPDYIKP